jgi:hypothetical protein
MKSFLVVRTTYTCCHYNRNNSLFEQPLPPPTPIQAIDKLISTIQNLDDDNVPQSIKTRLTAVLKQVSDILSDNNPNNDESAVCGKKLKFDRATIKNPLTCWQCMIVNVDS